MGRSVLKFKKYGPRKMCRKSKTGSQAITNQAVQRERDCDLEVIQINVIPVSWSLLYLWDSWNSFLISFLFLICVTVY